MAATAVYNYQHSFLSPSWRSTTAITFRGSRPPKPCLSYSHFSAKITKICAISPLTDHRFLPWFNLRNHYQSSPLYWLTFLTVPYHWSMNWLPKIKTNIKMPHQFNFPVNPQWFKSNHCHHHTHRTPILHIYSSLSSFSITIVDNPIFYLFIILPQYFLLLQHCP